LPNDIFALPNSQEYHSSITLPKKNIILSLFQNYHSSKTIPWFAKRTRRCFLISPSLWEVQRLTWSTCSKKEQLLLTRIYREHTILDDNVKGIHQEHNSFNWKYLANRFAIGVLHFFLLIKVDMKSSKLTSLYAFRYQTTGIHVTELAKHLMWDSTTLLRSKVEKSIFTKQNFVATYI
jgi:hypothetical protein